MKSIVPTNSFYLKIITYHVDLIYFGDKVSKHSRNDEPVQPHEFCLMHCGANTDRDDDQKNKVPPRMGDKLYNRCFVIELVKLLCICQLVCKWILRQFIAVPGMLLGSI